MKCQAAYGSSQADKIDLLKLNNINTETSPSRNRVTTQANFRNFYQLHNSIAGSTSAI